MFNHYNNSVPCVNNSNTPNKSSSRVLITEQVIPDGENFRLVKTDASTRLVDPDLKSVAVSPSARAAVGKVSPSANNFLQPSLEFQQQVAATLANLDDKFSYEAALEKLSESSVEPPATPNSDE